MKTVAPDYYKSFRCIASKCRHNCCIGWEIDIDKASLEYYKTVGGELGKRLSENIDTEDPDCPHFILGKDERCPFLGKDNLCDIIRTIGEDGLCNICNDHPRYRSFYSDIEEIGIGMCCEEAARMIVEKKDKTELVVIDTDGEETELWSDEADFFELRKSIFDILQNREINLEERLCEMSELCGVKGKCIPSASELARVYIGLEYMESRWQDILAELCEVPLLPELPAEYDTAFEQIAVYLTFRHLSKYLDGEELSGLARFILYGTVMIRYMCALHMAKNGSLGYEDIAEYARMYSSETEYSEDNTESIINCHIE